MKVGVIVFPGSNCDRDMYHVLTDVFKLNAEYFWHEKELPKNIPHIFISSVTGQGLTELKDLLWNTLNNTAKV